MELKIVILFVVAVTTAFPQVPLQPGQFFQPGNLIQHILLLVVNTKI